MDTLLNFLSRYGLAAMFLIILLEYAYFPVSSEIVLPFSGAVASVQSIPFYVILPASIRNSDFYGEAGSLMEDVMNLYQRMVDAGIPTEDARYVTPQAVPTTLILTMNARELRHFFALRCCNRAQWEIRQMADQMLEMCKDVASELFEDAGPGCIRGHCPEAHPCGQSRLSSH